LFALFTLIAIGLVAAQDPVCGFGTGDWKGIGWTSMHSEMEQIYDFGVNFTDSVAFEGSTGESCIEVSTMLSF
jgi:hypothetical protein